VAGLAVSIHAFFIRESIQRPSSMVGLRKELPIYHIVPFTISAAASAATKGDKSLSKEFKGYSLLE